jgi:putative ABC transport system permease protein
MLLRDVRYGIRSLLRTPSLTVVAVVTLGLGIGANTVMFSVIHGVLLRPLPFSNPDQVVTLWNTYRETPENRDPVSPVDFGDWQEQSSSFTYLAAHDRFSYVLAREQDPVRLRAARVSGDFFAVVGLQPALGRALIPADDHPGHDRVVVLSHRLWQSEFGGDAGIVGEALTLNGESYTVLGVMPAGFEFPDGVDLWAPLALRPDQLLPVERRTVYLRVLGRLTPEVTLAQAQAEMSTIARHLEEEYPESNTGRGVSVIPLHEHTVGDLRPALLVLFGAVGLVLLIACANVASLLLTRATGRQQEVAIRAALGADRAHLLRQHLTESTLLGLLGALGGLLLVPWGLDLVRTLSPEGVPRIHEIALDWRVLCFTLATGLGTGILCGLAPALMTSGADLHSLLRDGSRLSGQRVRRRLRRALVIAEISMAEALLIGGALLLQSFVQLRSVDPGFDGENVRTAQFELFSGRYAERTPRVQFYREVTERVAALPGVRAAALTTTVPLQGIQLGYDFTVQGRPAPAHGQLPAAAYDCVTPEFFRVMGIQLLAGRSFTGADGPDAPPVVIINDVMARRYWPGEDPIGQKIRIIADLPKTDPPALEIVGVAEGVRAQALDTGSRPAMFLPYAQRPWRSGFLLVRMEENAPATAVNVRSAVHTVDKTIALSDFRSTEDYLSSSVARPRFRTFLMGAFAALALVLATVGVYGVVSYSVGQRFREIGVRVAMGAQRTDIFKLVVREGLQLGIAGVALGLAAALALTRFLSGLLYGIGPNDPSTFAIISMVLVAVSLLACYLPARRAVRVDPVVTLRYE